MAAPAPRTDVSSAFAFGPVIVVEQLGGDTFLRVDAPEVGTTTPRTSGIRVVCKGETVGLTVDPAQSRLFDAAGDAVTRRA